MLWSLIRIELTKAFRPKLVWVTLAVMAAALAIDYSLFFGFRHAPSAATSAFLLRWPGALTYALGFASGYSTFASWGTYALIVVVGVYVARDYAWRTLPLLLARGVARPTVLAVKLGTAALAALLVVACCLVVIGGLGALFSVWDRGLVDVGDVDVPRLLAGFGLTAYSMLPYAALAALLAVIGRSAAIAVGGPIALLAVLEAMIGSLLANLIPGMDRVAQYLPSGLAADLDAQNAAIAHLAIRHTALQPDPWLAALGIAAYTLVFSAAALIALRRQDLTT